MSRAISVVAALALATFITGCEQHPQRYPEEEKSAERGIERAESAGADKHSAATLAAARRSLDEAREAEAAASKDRERAHKQLDALGPRAQAAKRKVALKQAQLEAEKGVREDLAADVKKLEARQEALAEKGATEAELKSGVGRQLDLARKRVASEDALVAALSQSLALATLEQKQIQLDQESAETRLRTSQQRYELARALYERSQELSSLAEAESYEVRRQRQEAELSGHPE